MKKERWVLWGYLSSRLFGMVLLQSITYLMIRPNGQTFENAGFYWAMQLSVINLVLFILMRRWFHANQQTYGQLFQPISRKETGLFLKLVIPLLLTAMMPNLVLSYLFYQDLQIGTTFLLGEIPQTFKRMNILVFPFLQGAIEIPFYFMFLMPRLKRIHANRWVYLGLPVLFLSIQHAFMPLRFDLLYLAYRSLVFLPFALVIGVVLSKRPKMLLYLVVLHILMNASLFMMYLIT